MPPARPVRELFLGMVPAFRFLRMKTRNCNSRESRASPAFTLIELLVVIAIISVLAAMLLPALKSKTFYTVAEGAMVFRCPSALPKVYKFGPTSRDDPEGAMAWPYPSESTGKRFHIDCWYGINGSTGNPQKWPFVRVPMDRSLSGKSNKFSSAARFTRMPTVFDGYWIHNGKDERINARHSKGTRSNLLFFDNSAKAYDTFRIPSVRDKEARDIQW